MNSVSVSLIHLTFHFLREWSTEAETGGSNEYYFFCKRGRKYRNSIRPNRVTGSGFWKATGIDKPVYDLREEGNGHGCLIGLKKTLVYYRGCAGKGAKTDWMMHEFRLPVANPASSDKCIPHPEEAAVSNILIITNYTDKPVFFLLKV